MKLPTHSNPNPPTNLAQGDIVAFIGYATAPPELVRIVSVRDDASPILYTIEFEGGATRFNANFFWDIGELVKQGSLEIPIGSLGLMIEWSSRRVLGAATITTPPEPQEEPGAGDPYSRLVDEHAQLDERLGKLGAFINTGRTTELPLLQHALLHRQHALMTELEAILRCRISTWVDREDQ